MPDLHARFPKLYSMHDSPSLEDDKAWDWEAVLKEVEDEADRDKLAWLRRTLEEHPVLQLVVVSGSVTVEAPPAWRAANPLAYAEALLMVCQYAAEAARKHLLPRLAGR